MKVKLLKKIRKRFKWKYLGDIEEVKRLPRKYWEILDSEGIGVEKLEHVSHIRFVNFVSISEATIAEQLVMRMKGLMYVFNHREHRAKMKNKSFKKKHFNE